MLIDHVIRGDIILETPSGRTITEYDTFIDSLCQTESIESATAVLSSQGLLLSAPGKVRAVKAWGIELPRRLDVTPLHEALLFQKDKPAEQVGFAVNGKPESIGGIVGIGVLAQPDELTDAYDMDAVKGMLGEPMALTTGSIAPDGSNTDGSQPRFSRKVLKFNLADVAVTGVHEFDQSFVMLPIEELPFL